MNNNVKRLIRIIAAALLYVVALVLSEINVYARLSMFLVSYLVVGYDVLWRAARNIFHGQIFDENFLMVIATIGAFALKQYPEAVAVMLFYQVGELFQSVAVDRSRKSIAALMDIRPDHANVIRDGVMLTVDPYDVQVGETIVVKVGEKVPLDGIVTDGKSMLDTVALTGESVPRSITVNDTLLSGCVNVSGVITATVTKPYGESTVNKILDLVENASETKSTSENFITKFARYYTPIVVILAALLAIIPPLFVPNQVFSDWLYRALTFLVISCPCALVISIPLSFFGGIGGASKLGILVKGGNFLESLSRADRVVFDKTGTLTQGVFKVTTIEAQKITKDKFLRYCAYAESYSTHPIANSLLTAFGEVVDKNEVKNIEEVSGEGVKAEVEGKKVLVGNAKLMKNNQISFCENLPVGTIVHLTVDGEYCGYAVISDVVKGDAREAIESLKKLGVKKTFMLTGDNEVIGKNVAEQLGIDEVYAQLLPTDKVDKVKELLAEAREGKNSSTLCYVGDGINDAPVIAMADVGFAMGGLGSDSAIESADVVIMTDEPSKVATALSISKRTMRIVKENIIFSIAVKVAVLVLGALGIATMWEAVFADVGVAVIAILNAVRMLSVRRYKKK